MWYGGVTDRVPIEAGLHRLMPDHRHVIKYLGHSVNKRLRMVRIYTAFAALGDLQDLYVNHKRLDNVVDHEGNRLHAPLIPTTAILYIFEAMAAGACLMAYGAVPNDRGQWPDGGDTPAPWGHDIVHRDIKPLNYFLSTPSDSAVWPGLPIAALGDFGNAFDAADPYFGDSPEATRGMATHRWRAPEQHRDAPEDLPANKLTNVYQIGLSILSLMTLQQPAFESTFENPELLPDGIFPESQSYPETLLNLAWDCIEWLPDDRPKPEELYMSIRSMAMNYPLGGSHQIPWRKLLES